MTNYIVDKGLNKYILFDGSKNVSISEDILSNDIVYGREFINNDPTNNFIVDMFVGILHLSSSKMYTTDKSNIIRKEFTPFFGSFPKILVKTKKIKTCPDEYALVKVEKYESGILYCCVIEYLNDLTYIKTLACINWSMKMNNKFDELTMVDLTPDRIDFTNLDITIYSIDPEGCKDIDDALHVIKHNDYYEIGIHIADVSSYIEEDNDFDKELSKRVQTIYFSDSQINMIPTKLSIENMSLIEKNKKRAFSVIITFNNYHEIIDVSFSKTIIKLKNNLSYDNAQSMIDDKLDNTLALLYEYGINIKNKYFKSSFDNCEKYDVHQMVAVYMILANSIVADKISKYDFDNVLLRCQPEFSSKNELKITNDDVDIELIKRHKISFYERAYYKLGTNDCNHSGLNINYYTHFTSPIRRYADILVHRQLWNIVNNNKIKKIDLIKIFSINHYSKYYKQVMRYENIISKCSKLFDNHIESDEIITTDAFITSIKSHNNSIRLYIPLFDIEYDHCIINKSIESLFKYETNDNVKITNIVTNKCLTLYLFQKIKINIVYMQKSIIKLQIVIIEPCIDFIL